MNTYHEIDSFQLPPPLDLQYQVLSCIKYSEQTATYLLRQKSSGKTVLLKAASDPLFARSLINEQKILEFIHQQNHSAAVTFPMTLELCEIQNTWYYIRTYIEGKTLEELCESNLKKPGIPQETAMNYIIQLAELLHFLHSLSPPVIHRDIKPQNVVVDTEGICHFIDLGISRFFGKAKKGDTLIMGTRMTAPPEQFGFQQTDTRSDLYSLGVLLHYCITGEYELSEESLSELDPPIRLIVQKATMFDPDKRYKSAREMLTDLLSVRYSFLVPDPARPPVSGSGRYRRIIALLLAVIFLLAGLLIYRNTHPAVVSTDSREPYAETLSAEAYTFREPLIEQAVRQILNIPEAPVTEEDLKKISSLHIMGLQIYSDDSEIWFKGSYPYSFNHEIEDAGLYLQQGTISSLEDIAHMPNLKILSLYGQQISDISLLKDTSIRELGLGYNPLSDLSPLRDNSSLEYLNLSLLDISDTDVLSTLTGLRTLNISETGISSLSGLENCPLERLEIYGVLLEDYHEIRSLPSLVSLELSYLTPDILNTLEGLPLKDLRFLNGRNLSLDDLSVLPGLETLYFRSTDETELQIRSPSLPALKELDIVEVKMKDFDRLSSLPSLNTLSIYGAVCENYDGLDQLASPLYIGCTDEQKQLISRQYPENHFIFLW